MGKAVIFSLASLLVVILFVSSSSIATKFKIQESQIEVTRTRVILLNSLVTDLENNYFDKLLYISSKNALIGLSKYYSETNFDSQRMKKNLGYAMQDVIYDGKLYDSRGNFQADLAKGYLDYNYTMKSMVNNISNILDSLGLEITELNMTLSPTNGTLQVDPWTIQVKGDFAYFISDKKGIVSWKGFTTKIVNISVYGLHLYDRQDGPEAVSNPGIVTSDWKLDNGTRTEDSVVSKLYGNGNAQGICQDYCQVN